jgi:hypothetical protein
MLSILNKVCSTVYIVTRNFMFLEENIFQVSSEDGEGKEVVKLDKE